MSGFIENYGKIIDWEVAQRISGEYTYLWPSIWAINPDGKTFLVGHSNFDIEPFINPWTLESAIQGTIAFNHYMQGRLKEYKKYQQPLKIRIAFSCHETEVNWTDKQLHKVYGKAVVKDIYASLLLGLSTHKKHPEFWAIAGNAYEQAKAVVK